MALHITKLASREQKHKTLTWVQRSQKMNRKHTQPSRRWSNVSAKQTLERQIFELELLSHGPRTVQLKRKTQLANEIPINSKQNKENLTFIVDSKRQLVIIQTSLVSIPALTVMGQTDWSNFINPL